MFRYSLTTIFISILFVALVSAGLTSPNELWMRIIATTTLLVLLASSITALARQSTGRWFWIGFAVAGWSYLAIAIYAGAEGRKILLTQYLISQLADRLKTSTPGKTPRGETVTVRSDDRVQIFNGRTGTMLSLKEAKEQGYLKYAYTPTTYPGAKHFDDICHYATSLLLGCIGGSFSLWLRRRRQLATG